MTAVLIGPRDLDRIVKEVTLFSHGGYKRLASVIAFKDNHPRHEFKLYHHGEVVVTTNDYALAKKMYNNATA